MSSLDRKTLAQFLPNRESIAAFEKIFKAVGTTLPSTIEEANALAGQSLAVASQALEMLAALAGELERMATAPSQPPQTEWDDALPRAHLGTISAQNADSVEVSGGTIDGTTIGVNTAAAAKFTTVAATGQITSTIATGTAPLVIASTTLVSNLHAAQADSLGTAGTYPADATDLASAITLVNYIKSRNMSKGV
jgi:hypothetical protein